MIDSSHGLEVGHGSRVMRVTGQLTDGSRGSRVTKFDPLSALMGRAVNPLLSECMAGLLRDCGDQP